MNQAAVSVSTTYKCGECGASDCKLWHYCYNYEPDQLLLCGPCAGKKTGKDISSLDAEGTIIHPRSDQHRIDQIGSYVPAIPFEDNNGYWPYAAVPPWGVAWWKKLSTLPVQIGG